MYGQRISNGPGLLLRALAVVLVVLGLILDFVEVVTS